MSAFFETASKCTIPRVGFAPAPLSTAPARTTPRADMVLLVLYVKAELENIESITFPPNIQYCFDVKDAQSDEEKKGVFLCADEIAEVDGSKGDANFAMRFPDCKKQCTVTFTDVKGVTRDTITAEDSGNFVPIRGFDCRGLELAKWTPTEGLVVKSTGGTKWENVDLGADPDGWFEYCEKCGESVGITELEFEFRTHKAK